MGGHFTTICHTSRVDPGDRRISTSNRIRRLARTMNGGSHDLFCDDGILLQYSLCPAICALHPNIFFNAHEGWSRYPKSESIGPPRSRSPSFTTQPSLPPTQDSPEVGITRTTSLVVKIAREVLFTMCYMCGLREPCRQRSDACVGVSKKRSKTVVLGGFDLPTFVQSNR